MLQKHHVASMHQTSETLHFDEKYLYLSVDLRLAIIGWQINRNITVYSTNAISWHTGHYSLITGFITNELRAHNNGCIYSVRVSYKRIEHSGGWLCNYGVNSWKSKTEEALWNNDNLFFKI